MITSNIYRKFLFRHSRKEISFLKFSQYWSTKKIKDYQFNKIKELLQHSYDNVSYYTNVFNELKIKPKDIRTNKDLEILPILTKDIVRKNFKSLIAKNYNEESLIHNSTGGSTGEPLKYFQDRQYEKWANAARIRGWYDIAGCENGETSAVLWGAMHEVKENFSAFERIKDYVLNGELYLNAFNLSDDRKIEFIKLCSIIKPKILRGYFTAIKDFAIFIDQNKLKFPKLKGIILGAETVDEESQQLIERVFKAPSYNTYGGRELSLIAMECEHKNGLHEISENNFVEFEPITLTNYEDAGNLIITNLNNYAMPFIRYRIGDIGIPGDGKPCSCGRGLPLIKKVIGRTTEVFTFYDGTKIAGEMFIHLMKSFPVNEYQFIQTSEEKVLLRYKKSSKISDNLKKEIVRTYKGYLPEQTSIEFEAVETIEKTPTGKFRFVLKDFTV